MKSEPTGPEGIEIAVMTDSIQTVLDDYLDQLAENQAIDTADLSENIARHLVQEARIPTSPPASARQLGAFGS